MALFTDGLVRQVQINVPPQRIVSLVPSQTELLFHLGLHAEVMGITKFCIHPAAWFQNKTRVGGTKNLHIEQIKTLNPDLVIANKEENVQAHIEELAAHFPVWVSDVNTLPDALHMIESVGAITGKSAEALAISQNIQKGFETFLPTAKAPTVVYLIWQDPYMSVGGDTFIHDILQRAGYSNLLAHRSRYPMLTEEALTDLGPEYLFLSSEPYPFGAKHIKGFQNILPRTKIVLVDGEMFSWYGSRLLHTPAYLSGLQQQLNTI